MKAALLKPGTDTDARNSPRAGILLPLPLPGPYDYRLPIEDGQPAQGLQRGTLVVAPLGPRETLGVVWGEAEGSVSDKKLKEAVPLDGFPPLPEPLCGFIHWVAR